MSKAPSLEDQLEALLFVASRPLTVAHLAEVTTSSPQDVEQALTHLQARIHGGLRLSELRGEYRLVTAPHITDTIQAFLQTEAKADLSRAALETLAIVAYRGPLAKAAIDHIRGVASDTMIRNLVARGLIVEAGKSREPGRPGLYAISHAFLQHFGLTSTTDLPPLPPGTAHDAA